VELAEIQRLTVGKLMSGVGFVVLMIFGVGLASNWSDIVGSFSGADWAYVPWIFVAMVLTFVAGAISLVGSVLRPVSMVDSTIVMFGQSFLNRFTPANAGGMAMRIRFLQKGGSPVAVATASVGLTSAASGVMQVVLITVFFAWAGSTRSGGTFDVDKANVGAIVVLAVAAAVGVVYAVPQLRRRVIPWLVETAKKIRDLLTGLLRRPGKLLALFGGAGASKLTTIVAFVLSCRAFDIQLGFAELGALYLTATTVASAVPTPGGVGAIEAALVAVLTGAGVESSLAWSASLLFRTITFWVPTVPGWIALKLSEKRGLV
jgi:undecaprenyl-diphosphatase